MLKRYRLQLAVAAAVVPGAAALGWTAVELVDGNWRPTLAWFAVLAAATVAEAIPVPIPRVSAGTTSLATVFLAAGAVKLGPEAAASAAALAILIAHSRREQPFVRRVYNTTLYGLAGFTAGYVCLALPEQLRIGVLAATAFYLVDVGLLTFVIAATTAERWISTAQTMFKTTFLPFIALGSMTVTVVALWDQGALVLSVGPPLLLLIGLQRVEAANREQRERLDRDKDEFVATASHELRTPLASVYGAATTLATREIDEETRMKLLDVLVTQTARLSVLVDEVLWAARLGADRVVAQPRDCNPLLALDELLQAETIASEGRVKLGGVTGDTCYADPEHLRRILWNLTENALHYSSGTVELSASTHNGSVSFFVDDQGSGIPPTDRDRIFERFVRLDPGMEANGGGTGLGLYICRMLAEKMGGDLTVQESPLGGARFALEVPRLN